MSDSTAADLRSHFRSTGSQRAQEMLQLLDALERDQEDAESLRSLLRHFHAFAGLGTTYGFPRVTEVGDAGEAALTPLVRDQRPPDARLLREWRALVERAADDLSAT